MLLLNFCYKHEWYTQRFLLLFIRHYLRLPIFVETFERLTKIFQFLKMIHSRYSRSYFNLLLLYTIPCMHVNTNLHKYENSCDSSKDRLDTKILSWFIKLPDKNFPWSFLSCKNLNFVHLNCTRKCCWFGAFAVCAKWLLLCFSK